MDSVEVAIAAWILLGASVAVAGTVLPADCTPAYSVELRTVADDPAENVTAFSTLPPDARAVFGAVRNGSDTTVDARLYQRHFEDATIRYSGTDYRMVTDGVLDCGTPGTLLQYAGLFVVALMSFFLLAKRSYEAVVGNA